MAIGSVKVSGGKKLTGDANTGDVLRGKTFYSNDARTKQTGSMPNLTSDASIQYESTNSTKVIPADASFLTTNTDGVERYLFRYSGVQGLLQPNTLFGVPTSDAVNMLVNNGKAEYVGSYNNGVANADNRVNTSSASYTSGYNTGVTDADARVNSNSASWAAGYNLGVSNADGRALPGTVNYQTGWQNGTKDIFSLTVMNTYHQSGIMMYRNNTDVIFLDLGMNQNNVWYEYSPFRIRYFHYGDMEGRIDVEIMYSGIYSIVSRSIKDAGNVLPNTNAYSYNYVYGAAGQIYTVSGGSSIINVIAHQLY